MARRVREIEFHSGSSARLSPCSICALRARYPETGVRVRAGIGVNRAASRIVFCGAYLPVVENPWEDACSVRVNVRPRAADLLSDGSRTAGRR